MVNRAVSDFPPGTLVLLHDKYETAVVLSSSLSLMGGREYCVLAGEQKLYYLDDELGLLSDETERLRLAYSKMKEQF